MISDKHATIIQRGSTVLFRAWFREPDIHMQENKAGSSQNSLYQMGQKLKPQNLEKEAEKRFMIGFFFPFLFKTIYFILGVCAWGYVCACSTWGGKKRAQEPQELDLWVLSTKLQSSTRAVSALNHWLTSPTPPQKKTESCYVVHPDLEFAIDLMWALIFELKTFLPQPSKYRPGPPNPAMTLGLAVTYWIWYQKNRQQNKNRWTVFQQHPRCMCTTGQHQQSAKLLWNGRECLELCILTRDWYPDYIIKRNNTK